MAQHSFSGPMETLLKQMDIWYRTPLGTYLLEAEQTALSSYLKDRGGQRVLQLGGPSEASLCPNNPYLHHIRIGPERHSVFKGPSVRASFDALPFLPQSLDVILFPHLLELISNPQQCIHQAESLLKAGGRLIILGFNPFSLWGLYKLLSSSKSLPWDAAFITPAHIKQLLKQEGLSIQSSISLFFRPPFESAVTLDRWIITDSLGPLLWPDNGAVYLIEAQKQVAPLISISEPLRAGVRF